jgi:hypothetical protein
LGKTVDKSIFWQEQIGGEFGMGKGEEFIDPAPNDPESGIYIPTWMSIDELPRHTNVYPADVARLVVKSVKEGWLQEPILVFEESK